MKKIGITVEVTRRYFEEIEIPDDEYEAFINGDIDELQIPEIELSEIFSKCRAGEGNEDTDYSITGDNDETIVAWN